MNAVKMLLETNVLRTMSYEQINELINKTFSERDEARDECDRLKRAMKEAIAATDYTGDAPKRILQDALKDDNSRKCRWVQDDPEWNTYNTGCMQTFQLTEDTPEKNQFKYCTYCGREIEQELWKESEESCQKQ